MPGVLVEDESNDPVIVDSVGNNESELGNTSALNLNITKKLQQNILCTLYKKVFTHDIMFENKKNTLYWNKLDKRIFVKCPSVVNKLKVVQISWTI